METSKHTEGEWKVEAKNLIKCNGEQIGSANSMLDEYEANAKVMASAPDLLKSMIELKKSMDETIKWQNGGLKHLSQAEQDRYKIICDTIDKATK
jgi:hypothetical protein